MGCGERMLMTVATIFLTCLAIFLEAADRAPVMETGGRGNPR